MKKVFALIVFSALAASMFFFVLARGQGQSEEQSPQAEVKHAIHHDVSPPLRDIQSLPRAEAQRERPLRSIPNGPFQNQEDPAVQANVGPLVGTTPGLNFAGVGEGDYGISTIFAPSDANVAVGDTQVVQWVNGPFLDIGVHRECV